MDIPIIFNTFPYPIQLPVIPFQTGRGPSSRCDLNRDRVGLFAPPAPSIPLIVRNDHLDLFSDRVSESIRRRDDDRVFPAVLVVSPSRSLQLDRPFPIPVDNFTKEYILNYWFALIIFVNNLDMNALYAAPLVKCSPENPDGDELIIRRLEL
jgi:hypothetical protein